MSTELELNIQAYLDGELGEREAREVGAVLESDADARQLLAELKTTAGVVCANEPRITLPESREFYWGKIQRAIEHEPQRAKPAFAFWQSVTRILVPAAGVALVLFLGIASLKVPTSTDPLAHLAEVENLSEHMTSFSFRSQSHNMFVVWLHENADHQTAGDSEAADFEDEMLQ